MNKIINFAFLTILSLMAASLFIKVTNISFLWAEVFLLIFGIVLYFISTNLTLRYINKKDPLNLKLDVYGKPPIKGEKYLWETTAKKGIVPKWVSWLGLWAFACFVAMVIWLVIWIF